MSYQNIYNNLLVQFNKVFAHNRQGSYKTKERYADAFRRLLRFLAAVYHMERLANISSKHLYAYSSYLVEQGKSIAYIKTELAAIRFFYDQVPTAKNHLPTNEQLHLAHRQFGGIDRTWSEAEQQRFTKKAQELGRQDYIDIAMLGRQAGLRIHECFRLDTCAATNAIARGAITAKGKGGLVRTVPIGTDVVEMLRRRIATTPRGHKLFVADGDKTHLAIHRLENFICYHRQTIQDEGSSRPMTFHGLRHTYAAEQYEILLEDGASELEARARVSLLLGHGRDDVTRIYTVSVENYK